MSKVWRGSFYKEKTKCTPYISVAPELGVNPTFLRVVEITNNNENTLPDMYGKVYIGRGSRSIVVRYAIDKELSYISKYEYLKLFYSKQVRQYAGDYYQKSVKIPIHLCEKQIFVIASISEQLDFDEPTWHPQ